MQAWRELGLLDAEAGQLRPVRLKGDLHGGGRQLQLVGPVDTQFPRQCCLGWQVADQPDESTGIEGVAAIAGGTEVKVVEPSEVCLDTPPPLVEEPDEAEDSPTDVP